MRCSICGGDTKVSKTRERDAGTKVWRRRVCLLNTGHVTETLERFLPPSLEKIGVRQSGSMLLARGAFDRDRLERDISQAILRKPGSEPDNVVRATVDAVVRHMQVRLVDSASPVTSEERRQNPNITAAVFDYVVADAVEAVLERQGESMPRALYALSIRGRQDRSGRPGWATARDVLEWIYEAYPELADELPATATKPTGFAWLPGTQASRPDGVLKRTEADRPSKYFHSQFVKSIRQAMLGRAEAEEKSVLIAEWVLHGLHGQRLVRSAQLGAGVLDALRRLDDVAYLRWAVIFKRLTSITDLADEARALVLYPSPPLVFKSPEPTTIERGTPLV